MNVFRIRAKDSEIKQILSQWFFWTVCTAICYYITNNGLSENFFGNEIYLRFCYLTFFELSFAYCLISTCRSIV